MKSIRFNFETLIIPLSKALDQPDDKWEAAHHSARAGSSHKAEVTQGWLAKNRNNLVTPNMRSPCSPDVSPMDFYMCGAVEEQTNNRPHHNKESLRGATEHELGNMQGVPLIRARVSGVWVDRCRLVP